VTRTSDERRADDHTGCERVVDAALDRADELVRDRAAEHVVDELEALAAPARLDPQEHLGELPGAAGLLLQPEVALGRPR
jgi:hypothetical protein